MERTLLLLLITLITSVTYAQEFSFKLFFTDAVGNKDTLILGYDSNAGDSIDTIFGEENIIDEPWDSIFEVRIGSTEFETKIQIKENNCGNDRIFCSSDLYVLCKNWPLIITWDSNLLNNDCSEYSVLTDCNPGGWFDTDYSFVAALALQDTIIVDEYLVDYIINEDDIIRIFYIDIGNEGKYGAIWGPFDNIVDNNSKISYKLYPNPLTNRLYLDSFDFLIKSIRIYNLKGTQLIEYINDVTNTYIDLSNLSAGVYIVSIESTNGIIRQKIIKE